MEDVPEEIDELPKSETELIALARRLIALLTDNPKFAGLPVSADELRRCLDKFIAARNADTAAQVALIQAEAEVEKAFNELREFERRLSKTGGKSSGSPILWN